MASIILLSSDHLGLYLQLLSHNLLSLLLSTLRVSSLCTPLLDTIISVAIFTGSFSYSDQDALCAAFICDVRLAPELNKQLQSDVLLSLLSNSTYYYNYFVAPFVVCFAKLKIYSVLIIISGEVTMAEGHEGRQPCI